MEKPKDFDTAKATGEYKPLPAAMSLSYGRNNKYEMTCYES